MKRILSLALGAMMLATATGGAAVARPWHGGGGGWHGGGWHGDGNGAALAAGLGLFALGAIIASDHDRYDDRYDDRYAPPPPPPPQYGRGYDRGYDDYDR